MPQSRAAPLTLKYHLSEMKKQQLAKQLAKESHISPGAAADQVDHIVRDLLARIRKGQSASLPGLGTFRSGPEKDFQFDSNPAKTKRGSK